VTVIIRTHHGAIQLVFLFEDHTYITGNRKKGRNNDRQNKKKTEIDKQTTMKTLKRRYIHVKNKLYLLPKTFTKAVPLQLKILHM
jgi:hypothetical protein